jgi:hypothetical protein
MDFNLHVDLIRHRTENLLQNMALVIIAGRFNAD